MDGSIASLIAIPVVVTISLAVWLIAVFYADSHPRWRGTGSLPASRPVPAATRAPERVPARPLPVPAPRPAPIGTALTSMNTGQAGGSGRSVPSAPAA